MVNNDGECVDCDFGDTPDRAWLRIRAMGFHSDWFFDSPAEGVTSQSALQPFGQATDLTDLDDVYRWGFTLGYMPVDEAEREEEARALGRGDVVLNGVLKNTFTDQDSTSAAQSGETCTADGSPQNRTFDCTALRPRGASYWVPDLWVKLLWRPTYQMLFRAELELAATYGEVGFTQNIDTPASDKDFLAFGGVLQLELQHEKLSYELEVGFATGDDVAYGPYGSSFVAPDETYASDLDGRLQSNRRIERFLFHRDYHVDLLLYREVIGAVTNTVYVKPSVTAHLLKSSEQVLGATLSVLYGHALERESTPGREAPLGVESDLTIFFEVPGIGRADFETGILVPLGAFRNLATGEEPGLAYAFQARITMTF